MQASKLLTIEELEHNPKARKMVREMDIARLDITPTDDDKVQQTGIEGSDKSSQVNQHR